MTDEILVLTQSEKDSLPYAAPETEIAKAYAHYPIVVVRTRMNRMLVIKGRVSEARKSEIEQSWKDEDAAHEHPLDAQDLADDTMNPDKSYGGRVDNTPVAKSDSVRNVDSVHSSDEVEEDGALFDPDKEDGRPRSSTPVDWSTLKGLSVGPVFNSEHGFTAKSVKGDDAPAVRAKQYEEWTQAFIILKDWATQEEGRAFGIVHDPNLSGGVGRWTITLYFFEAQVLDEDHSEDLVVLARELISRYPSPEAEAMEE